MWIKLFEFRLGILYQWRPRRSRFITQEIVTRGSITPRLSQFTWKLMLVRVCACVCEGGWWEGWVHIDQRDTGLSARWRCGRRCEVRASAYLRPRFHTVLLIVVVSMGTNMNMLLHILWCISILSYYCARSRLTRKCLRVSNTGYKQIIILFEPNLINLIIISGQLFLNLLF